MKEKLSIKFPEELASALYRRHNGANRSKEEIQECFNKLNKMYRTYLRNKNKLHHLLYIEWDKKAIEKHFQEPIWYNAHARRKRYEKNINDCHRQMFYILTNFDGNGREEFCGSSSISIEDIMNDFKGKYLK